MSIFLKRNRNCVPTLALFVCMSCILSTLAEDNDYIHHKMMAAEKWFPGLTRARMEEMERTENALAMIELIPCTNDVLTNTESKDFVYKLGIFDGDCGYNWYGMIVQNGEASYLLRNNELAEYLYEKIQLNKTISVKGIVDFLELFGFFRNYQEFSTDYIPREEGKQTLQIEVNRNRWLVSRLYCSKMLIEYYYVFEITDKGIKVSAKRTKAEDFFL